MFTPAQRAEMEEFIARQIAPKSARRIAGILKDYSDSDLLKVMTASNLHADRYSAISGGSSTGNAVGGFVSGNDIETIEILAENAEHIRSTNTSITEFHEIIRALERLGIIPLMAGSFPAMRQHLKAAEYSYLSMVPYSKNEALIMFIQENLHRYDEVIEYMEEHQTQEIGRLRAHFHGEALALSEGMI